uniref:Uncharacterized protein n=1 Tax=Arundo donax TaxID=35708 RepID=A0A0A9SMG0_ARUDO
MHCSAIITYLIGLLCEHKSLTCSSNSKTVDSDVRPSAFCDC